MEILVSSSQALTYNFTPVPPVTDTARLLILQGGNDYTAAAPGTYPGNGIFTTISASGLTATNFNFTNMTDGTVTDPNNNSLGPGGIDWTLHPNFSSSGGAIEIGNALLAGFNCGSGDDSGLTCPFPVRQSVSRQNFPVTINDPIMFSDLDFSDLGNYNIIDFVSASSPSGAVTSTVGFVPKPSSFLLILCGIGGLGCARRRQRLILVFVSVCGQRSSRCA